MTGTATLELTGEQVEFFRVNGFLQLDHITTNEEIDWFRTVYDEILGRQHGEEMLRFEGARGDGSTGTIEQVIAPEIGVPEILNTTYMINARAVATTLLGVAPEQIERSGTMIVYKPAGAGRDTPWHQDEAYWDQPDTTAHSLSVWMPLDPVTVDSGCMQFLPGSHLQDVLPHKHMGLGEPLQLDVGVETVQAVACPLPAGGATVHHCRTLHFTGPNMSDQHRRAISAVFHGPTIPRQVPLPRPWLPLTPLV